MISNLIWWVELQANARTHGRAPAFLLWASVGSRMLMVPVGQEPLRSRHLVYSPRCRGFVTGGHTPVLWDTLFKGWCFAVMGHLGAGFAHTVALC